MRPDGSLVRAIDSEIEILAGDVILLMVYQHALPELIHRAKVVQRNYRGAQR